MRIRTFTLVLAAAALAASCRCGKDSGADAALDRAIRNGDVEAARRALEHGADSMGQGRIGFDLAQVREGRRPEEWLGIYAKRVQLLNVRLLSLDDQMCPGTGRKDAAPTTPGASGDVDLAGASREALDAVRDLSRTVVDGARQELKASRVHLAALFCQPATVAALASRGADVRARDGGGLTPLHWASCAPVVDALLAAGADPRAASAGGLTPLHMAIDREVVRSLLRAGADLEARDACGNRPLHTAAWFGLGGSEPGAGDPGTLVGIGKAEGGILDLVARLVADAGDRIGKLLDRFDVAGELVRAGASVSARNDAGNDARKLAIRAHAHHHD